MADKTVEEKLDAIFDSISKRMDASDARMDAACSRMDSFAKKDAEKEEAEEKAKKDAAEKEEAAKKDAAEKEEAAKKDAAEKEEAAKKDAAEKEEQAKKDAAARAAVNPDYAARLAAIEASMLVMPATGSGADRKPYIDAQVKADPVYHAFGDSGAPPAMRGESVDGYQRRLLSRFKQHSPKWKDKDLAKLDASVLDIAEEQIYADATTAALHPADVPEGVLRRIESRDSAGRMRAHYVGSDERAAWAQFTNGGMTGRFLIPAKH